ncbi:putative late blight resistance protein homolog R1A-3 [Henckelia pumila]|uniref:putative late blight resistance protein homolog R1A-3 n=1 Tax=Henckelia pumila TaxID=405737 RepID=UPI003C6E370D
MASFPEDSEIDVSKLIKLWVAEGFLKPYDQSKCSLEDVGEHYLEDLVNRSLLSVRKKGPYGKLESVGIHDMLREICITKAEEEGFLHQFSSKTNSGIESMEINPHRRLKIHSTRNFQEWSILYSRVRSILLFSEGYDVRSIYVCSRSIAVLDAPHVLWSKFELLVSTSVHLRYLAFALDLSSSHTFPFSSISKHPNLETLVVRVTHGLGRGRERERYRGPLQVPYEILKMPRLRHLIWDASFHLSNPLDDKGLIVHESDIQTMETVRNFRFDEEIIKILVNLKKLQVEYHIMKNRDTWDDFNFDELFRLRNLEDLEMSMLYYLDPSMVWKHAFPTGLKRLYLRCVPFPWENMDMIGSLPNLQVLEMIDMRVAKVSEWTTAEDQFLQLKYFRCTLDFLIMWEMEKEHFPCLESLILVGAEWINEIPSGIGEIDTLQYLELMYCKKSLVDSARRIEKEQRENGNSAFQLRVIVQII